MVHMSYMSSLKSVRKPRPRSSSRATLLPRATLRRPAPLLQLPARSFLPHDIVFQGWGGGGGVTRDPVGKEAEDGFSPVSHLK